MHIVIRRAGLALLCFYFLTYLLVLRVSPTQEDVRGLWLSVTGVPSAFYLIVVIDEFGNWLSWKHYEARVREWNREFLESLYEE